MTLGLGKAPNPLHDETRLVDLVEGRVTSDRLALAVLGPEVLAEPSRVVGDQCVGRGQDVAARTVILLQPDDLRIRVITLKGLNIFDLRAAPAVDRLIVVADGEEVVVRPGQEAQPSVLDGVGVLKLVDQDMREASLIVPEDVRTLAQQLQGLEQKIGKVEQTRACALFFVLAIDRDHLVGEEIASAVDVVRPQTLVLLLIDEALHLTGRPTGLVELHRLEDPLDQTKLVVRIQDLELLRELRVLPVRAQKSMGESVEGADPHPADRHAEHGLDSTTHLARCFVGEGDRQHRVGRHLLHLDQPGDAMDQDARLAGPGAGEHQQITGLGGDGGALSVVEWIEKGGDIHRRDSTQPAQA